MNSLKRENNLLKVEIATLKNRLNMIGQKSVNNIDTLVKI